jgi:phosphohistidine swiveling domain-containing protein
MRGCNAARLGRVSSGTAAIATQPKSQQALIGRSLSLSVTATGSDLLYQWHKDGHLIAGATASIYSVASVTAADAGSYTVVVSNATSSKTSDAAVVAVDVARQGRIYGLAARGPAGGGSATMIVGVAMAAGTDGANKNIVFRGLGPELVSQGVANTLPNPQIELYQGSNRIAVNKDWGGASALRQAFLGIGLSDLPSASLDAALLVSLVPGNYTALISDEAGGSGIALGELYDTDTTAPGTPARAAQGRLFGISARALVSTGDNVLIAGFSFDGNVPMTLLIQGVGPSLVPQGVTNPVLNPHLDLYQGSAVIASNEKWGGSNSISQAAAKSGATTLIGASSNDSALLITLQPGTYTAILKSADGNSGVGLVEVYEVP